MAMKIPTFKAQTQLSGEVGNTNFSIQANPQALSQGAMAQANFGNQVSQFGGQVFEMGKQLQEIKNTSDAQRIENEYKKISVHIQKRAELLNGETDVTAWVKTEREKARLALLSGATYTLESLHGQDGDQIVFNAKADGSANDIVKNNSVKTTANLSFDNIDLLGDPNVQKISAIQYTNNLTASFQAREDGLISDLIENHDTAEGAIAYDAIFGPDGLIDQKRKANLYKNYADQYEDVQTLTNLISEGILNNMTAGLAQNENSDNEEVLQNQIKDYADRLNEKGPNGSYKLFPNMTKTLRDELIKKSYDAVYENIKKNNQMEELALDLEESRKQKAIKGKEFEFIQDIITQKENFDVKRLDHALYSENIDEATFKTLKLFVNNQEFGSLTRASRSNTSDFMTALYKAKDPRELDRLQNQINTQFINKEMLNDEYLSRNALITSRRQNRDTEYGRQVELHTDKLKAKLKPLSLEDGFGTNTTLAESSILSNFVVAIAPKDGVYPTTDQIKASYNQAVIDYYTTQAEIIADDFTPLAIAFGSDVIDNYNSLYEDDDDLGDVASLFFPVIKANPEQFKKDMRLAYNGLPIAKRTETRKASFEAKLEDVVLMANAYDPSVLDKYKIDSDVDKVK